MHLMCWWWSSFGVRASSPWDPGFVYFGSVPCSGFHLLFPTFLRGTVRKTYPAPCKSGGGGGGGVFHDILSDSASPETGMLVSHMTSLLPILISASSRFLTPYPWEGILTILPLAATYERHSIWRPACFIVARLWHNKPLQWDDWIHNTCNCILSVPSSTPKP